MEFHAKWEVGASEATCTAILASLHGSLLFGHRRGDLFTSGFLKNPPHSILPLALLGPAGGPPFSQLCSDPSLWKVPWRGW